MDRRMKVLGVVGLFFFLIGALIFLISSVGAATDIDTCVPFTTYNPVTVPVFNSTDNTTSNQTFYAVSGSIQICPKHTAVSFLNLTAGYSANGSTGTCDYNVSVQNLTDMFPRRSFNFTLSNGGNYRFNDTFIEINADADALFCPVCPVPKICSRNDGFPGFINESYDWKIYEEGVCDINITVPAKPYCLSDDKEWLMSHTCVESGTLGNLLQMSNQTAELEAKVKIYEGTWSSPRDICKLAPKVLADGWGKLSFWERNHLYLFASLGDAPVKLETFANMAMPTSTNPDEMTNNLNQARMALENYRMVNFADYWKENVTTGDGRAYPQIVGYRSLISTECVNQTASLSELSKQEHSNGWWNGAILAVIGFVVLIIAGLTILDMRKPE
jgi:hypothetical protein